MSVIHFSWDSKVLQERPMVLTLRLVHSSFNLATAPSSVVQTGAVQIEMMAAGRGTVRLGRA
jgi:hypothetical protein